MTAGSHKKQAKKNRNKKKVFLSNAKSSSIPQQQSIFRSALLAKELPLIVVDCPNVAMRHGASLRFSCKGIQLALEFFHRAGHKVVGFLPDYYLNLEKVGELRRSAKLGIIDVKTQKQGLPDDVSLLLTLVGKGYIVGTPAQDYDDSYSIAYARLHGGYIVSNDMYRDHVKGIEPGIEKSKLREEVKKWLKSHVISYTFVGDEFIPNPDASFA